MSFASIPMRLRPTCPLVPAFRSLSLGCRLENAAATQTVIPKKPSSPWIRYYAANYALVKKVQPNAKTQDIMKQLSSKWKLMAENQKVQYVNAYEKEKEMYKIKVAKIPEGAIAEANQESAKKRATKAKNKANSELKELLSSLKKPTRPKSAYILFYTGRLPSLTGKTIGENSGIASKEWSAMTDQQKLSYDKKAEAATEQYKKDLVNWNNKMNKMGKLETIMDAETKLSMAKKKLKESDI